MDDQRFAWSESAPFRVVADAVPQMMWSARADGWRVARWFGTNTDIDGARRRLDRLVQRALVRLHRADAGRSLGLGLAGRAPSGGFTEGHARLAALDRDRRTVRDGVPAARSGRAVPLVPHP